MKLSSIPSITSVLSAFPIFSLILLLPQAVSLNAAEAAADIVTIDENAVQNLGIRTVKAKPASFERTAFALGAIEAIPQSVGIVSSRISGRVVGLSAYPGDEVKAGARVAEVESRLPGGESRAIALTAPVGGTVTQLSVRLGDPVEPDRPLLEITGLSEVYAVAKIPEFLASQLVPGAVANIRIPALGSEPLQGRLLRFGSLANAQSATVDAYFVLANPSGRIVPGMRAEFAVVLDSRADVISVPRKAVQVSSGSRFVFVAHPDVVNSFVRTPVVVGANNETQIEILSGLTSGSEVVADGAYSLSFVGGGGASLKEALDAAHGHAHNEDGSEITADSRSAQRKPAAATVSDTRDAVSKSAEGEGKPKSSSAHDHDDDHSHGETHSDAGDHSEHSHDDHDHDHPHKEVDNHDHGLLGSARLWQTVSAILFVLLLASLWGKKHPRADDDENADDDADGAISHGAKSTSATQLTANHESEEK